MTRKTPVRHKRAKAAAGRASDKNRPDSDAYVDALIEDFRVALKARIGENTSLENLSILATESKVIGKPIHDALQLVIAKVRDDTQKSFGGIQVRQGASKPLVVLAENMQQSVEALGTAMADLPEPVSPQLARSLAATEHAWRDLEKEFGLLTSIEVSTLLGSDPPNRAYASSQRSQGKLIAVKRPKGLLYPGFQFSGTEPGILPVIAELKTAAEEAGRSESSLALWMTRATSYLGGDRPVDRLSEPELVVQAAQHSFGVQW